MEIKPHPKLIVKQALTLLTISIVVIMAAFILQMLITLDEKVDPEQSAAILMLITILALLLLWIIIVPIVVLWIKNLDYFVEDDRITIHKGILTKMQQNIPYRSITDFMLYRSLYDRFLGIGSIKIQTAGQAKSATGYEGKLSGLLQWDELLQELRSRVKKLHPVSEALATTEEFSPKSDQYVFQSILDELKAIRKLLETSNQ